MILLLDHGLFSLTGQGRTGLWLARTSMRLLGSPLVGSAPETAHEDPENGIRSVTTGKDKAMLNFKATQLNDLSLRSFQRQYKHDPSRRLPLL
ncbi:hypothetical protein ACFY5D_07065 [Paeniglutamicibacter sp. NPDC012692]|uniref:hypothetical protein n=1 Tax=Paeniglutamicibacter sp. NPDC012692 TaxID=3364388 RepID=UPI0036969CBE